MGTVSQSDCRGHIVSTPSIRSCIKAQEGGRSLLQWSPGLGVRTQWGIREDSRPQFAQLRVLFSR